MNWAIKIILKNINDQNFVHFMRGGYDKGFYGNTIYFHSYAVFNQKFIVPSKFKLLKVLGKGSYGVVWKAINKETNEELAIK